MEHRDSLHFNHSAPNVDKLCELPPIPEVPELLVTPEDEQLCLDDCANSCRTFDDPNDTWKKCSACPIDGLAHDLDGRLWSGSWDTTARGWRPTRRLTSPRRRQRPQRHLMTCKKRKPAFTTS